MSRGTRTIGLLAHVDAGKTTTAENIIYTCGGINRVGDVNKGTSQLDYDATEQARGITIFADQIELKYKGQHFSLVDTPGHVDFGCEMERALKILDGAVLIVSGPDGIQAHTETIWNMLQEYRIPTFIFVNKMDRDHIDVQGLAKRLKSVFGSTIVIGQEELKERVIEEDEGLLESYLSGDEISETAMQPIYEKLIADRAMTPVIFGSALTGQGIEDLLDKVMSGISASGSKDSQPAVYTYKVKVDDKLGRLAYVKVMAGSLKVRAAYQVGDDEYKITGLHKVNGNQYEQVDELSCGEIGAIKGLPLQVGEGIGAIQIHENMILPVLSSRIHYEEADVTQVREAFNILHEEDPSLNLHWNPERKELTIGIMGTIHMEIIAQKIKERFGLDISLTKPFVHYKETVSEVSTGFCHFEPKKHFAEVEVELVPLPLGSGVQFESKLSVDVLPIQFQKVIEEHVYEGLKHGPLLGAEVTDVQVNLIAGVHHLEHTHGGDFAIATVRAVQQALEKNSCKILEPLYGFKVTVEAHLAGKIMSDLSQRYCQEEILDMQDDKAVITGYMPVSKAIEYPIYIASQTGGKGVIQLRVHHYDPCHNEDEVIEDFDNHIDRDEKRFNSITILRHKKKMKKVTYSTE